MKTVQEWLREVDEKELTDTYLAEFPIDYKMIADRSLTLGMIRNRCKERFLAYLHELKTLEPVKPETPEIFFAHKQWKAGHSGVETSLCKAEELCTKVHPECYSWICVDFAKAMGYLISDAPLTQKNILVVLAQILHELSFFGYTQEEMEEEREKLEASLNECEEGKTHPIEELWGSIGPEKPEPDPEAEALEQEIRTAETKYNLFCQSREMEKLREMLSSTEQGSHI